jgi:hypothetical protein
MTGPATYEQLPHILDAGIAVATPAQDGAGSDYIYTYNLPTTAQGTIKTYTIEAGDNTEAEELPYSFVTDFSLSGAAGAALDLSANWQGRQWNTTDYTPSTDVSIPVVEEILVSKARVYIMPTSDAPTTDNIKEGTLLSFALNVTTGQMAYHTADGQLYFYGVKQTMPEVTLELTMEHVANATAEKAAWRAGTSRRVYLVVTGSTVTTPGTTYSAKTLIIDLYGKWETFSALGEQDGNDTITGTLRARYNETAATAGSIIVVNELASMP